jgi:hypothetical protein
MRMSSPKLYLPTIVVVVIAAVVLVSVSACGGGSSATTSSSTTIGVGQTTTTTAIDQTSGATTTSVADTGSTTSSTDAATTTTEAAPTTDTADHSADFRAQYPSTESFTDSNWATLNAAPASHLGAAVDITGQPSGVTVDPDSKYLTWQLSISVAGGAPMQALCRTNIGVDRSLLSGSGSVEVRGMVVGVQGAGTSGGPIIYVQSIQKAAEPATTTT